MVCMAFHSCKQCGHDWQDGNMLSATCPSCGEKNADCSRAHKAAMNKFWIGEFKKTEVYRVFRQC